MEVDALDVIPISQKDDTIITSPQKTPERRKSKHVAI
jgi:hypothetical protein